MLGTIARSDKSGAEKIIDVAAFKATYGAVLDTTVRHGQHDITLARLADQVATGSLA